MSKLTSLLYTLLLALAGCTFGVPYRTGEYIADASCEEIYRIYDAAQVSSPEALDIGWRGKSLIIPLLDQFTFWERKNTAERVAQGSVQELLRRLDLLRDTGT